jgi:hypothetical protein
MVDGPVTSSSGAGVTSDSFGVGVGVGDGRITSLAVVFNRPSAY